MATVVCLLDPGEDAGVLGMTRLVVDQVFAPRAVDAMLTA